MDFHGEYYDSLVNVDTNKSIVSANTSELQEWIRVHPALHRHKIRTPLKDQFLSVEEYMKLENVYTRNK